MSDSQMSPPKLVAGVALVAALATVGMTGAVVGTLENDVVVGPLEGARARAMAESGIEHGLAVLRGARGRAEIEGYLLGDDRQRGTDDDGRLLEQVEVVAGGSYDVRVSGHVEPEQHDDDDSLVVFSTGRSGRAVRTVRVALARSAPGSPYRVVDWREIG